jgi:hypothetical protein
MSRIAAVLITTALALPVTGWAQGTAVGVATGQAADGTRVEGAEVQVRARVVELDAARRSVTLRGPRGDIVTVEVPPEVTNFDQVRVGDTLVIRYRTAVAVRIEPARRSGIRERVESSAATVAPAGSLPGTAATRTVEVHATVEAVDRRKRTVTLRGARRTVTVAVPEGIDLEKLKLGSDVHAAFVESAVISVEHAPPRRR